MLRILRPSGVGDCGAARLPAWPMASVRAMASKILTAWRLADASQPFRQRLVHGAPSDDTFSGALVSESRPT
jgi:hypothetical protein